jgi:Sap, sulfolipid-1-addressing protein
MTSVQTELWVTGLAAMLSPTTLTFSVLVLVLGTRPLRTGLWFYLGAFGATLVIGIIGVIALGGDVSSKSSQPKTWVCIVDIVFGLVVAFFAVRLLRAPPNPKKTASMTNQMTKVASSPAVAVLGAGAMLANPGGFIPIALKDISQLKVSTTASIAYWVGFTVLALLPLLVALILLVVSPDRAKRILARMRHWLERRMQAVAGVILFLLAIVLVRNGIAGLT